MRQLISYCTFAGSHVLMWLRHGHMIDHFLTALACLSRVRVLVQACLAYSADAYTALRSLLSRLCAAKCCASIILRVSPLSAYV